ncbi:NAD(+)/NADH kinase [Clostridium sediminicola]|uniref:sugar kinase n=1 Tax=Clostridium sediminicola TaxID=3114879 RepID=UPI0031F1DDB7
MKRFSDRKIIVIKRSTRLEDLIKRYNTLEQAKFYVETLGGDFSDYLEEEKNYREAIKKLFLMLEPIGNVQLIDRMYVPNFIFGNDDIVIVVGQDGLVANTMKYLNEQPIIAINPDCKRWDGKLLPFQVKDSVAIVKDVIYNRYKINEVTMAKVSLNDGQILYAVNDFYLGQKTHVSSRYKLTHGNITENQSSSGIIISTGLGLTGWMKSVLAGASNVMNSLTGGNYDLNQGKRMAWNDRSLVYSVREPFPSNNTSTSLGFGIIKEGNLLLVQSMMAENGVIFSDGVEDDFLSFNAGITATFDIGERVGRLVKG